MIFLVDKLWTVGNSAVLRHGWRREVDAFGEVPVSALAKGFEAGPMRSGASGCRRGGVGFV